MTILHVQGGVNNATSGSFSLTLGSAVGNGNLVAGVFLASNQNGTPTSITDNSSNTYNFVDGVSGNGVVFYPFYLANITNSPTTLTVNFAGNLDGILIADEFSGVATSSALDVHVQNFNNNVGGSNSVTSTTALPTANGDLIYGLNAPTVTCSVGTNFALLQASTGGVGPSQLPYLYSEWQVQATAASIAATFTPSAGAYAYTEMMTFFAATGGGASFALSGQSLIFM